MCSTWTSGLSRTKRGKNELQKSGFDMQKLSIVGKDYQTEEAVVGYYTMGDRVKAWGKTGAFWGGLWGLLLGSAFFLVPGIGPLFAAGPVVGWKGRRWPAALARWAWRSIALGFPKTVSSSTRRILAGKFVVITHGSQDEVSKTKAALTQTNHQGMREHSCCA
jgi:hypothetical protein